RGGRAACERDSRKARNTSVAAICRNPAAEARANSPLAGNRRRGQPCSHMRFIETVFHKLKRHPKRIVFPEGTEPRVLRAAARFVKLRLGAPVVLGHRAEIEKVAAEGEISLDHIGVIDPATSSEMPTFIQRLEKLKRYRDLGSK